MSTETERLTADEHASLMLAKDCCEIIGLMPSTETLARLMRRITISLDIARMQGHSQCRREASEMIRAIQSQGGRAH